MKKTLVPMTKPEMDLVVACLAYCEAHPSHKDIEITDIKEKMLYFSLKDKCSEPVKVVPEGSREKKAESKFKDTSTDTAIVEIPMPTQSLLDKLNQVAPETTKLIQGMSKVGKRTQNKLNSKKPPFGLA